LADRQPYQLPAANGPLLGRPLDERPPDGVRPLSWEQCRSLAEQHAPLAAQMESHSDWLRAHSQETLADALQLQAAYERSQHRLLAEELWLDLANVYAQTTVLDQSHEFLRDLSRSVQEFRQAGLPVTVSPDQLERQELVIDSSGVELLYNQRRLNDALEVALSLTAADPPLWPTVNGLIETRPTDPDQAVTVALQQRGDYLAWQRLACHAEQLPAESLRQLGAAQPWLASGVPIPSAAWWMCRLKQTQERMEQQERQQRAKQLQAIAQSKRDQIRLEVRQHWHALWRIEAQLQSLLQQRESLRRSMAATLQAREQQPLDVQTYLNRSSEDLKLTSEIITLLFEQEKERCRLNQAIGH
jgi:hypothetical protein